MDERLHDLERKVESDPTDAAALAALARAYRRQGRLAEAYGLLFDRGAVEDQDPLALELAADLRQREDEAIAAALSRDKALKKALSSSKTAVAWRRRGPEWVGRPGPEGWDWQRRMSGRPPGLPILAYRGSKKSRPDPGSLAILDALPALRAAWFRFSGSIDKRDLKALAALDPRCELSLQYSSFKGAQLEQLTRLAPTLRSLAINNGATSMAGKIKPLAGLERLRSLDLTGARGLGDQDLAALRGLGALEEIKLASTIVEEAGGGLAEIKSLRSLNFRTTSWSEGVGVSALKALPQLERITLSFTAITDALIASLSELPVLSYLDLSYARAMTDARLGLLAGARALRELDLTAADLSDAGLASLAGCETLERLVLTSCRRLSGEGLLHLRGLKRLRVIELNGLGIEEPRVREALPQVEAVVV